MAERRSMDHNVYASFHPRITPHSSASAAENLAMGTKTFEETLATWKSSYGHNANLLNRNVTRMGLASASRDGTTYWALILAAPPEPPQSKVRVLSIFPPIILMRLGTPWGEWRFEYGLRTVALCDAPKCNSINRRDAGSSAFSAVQEQLRRYLQDARNRR
jgi:hypothetical protein